MSFDRLVTPLASLNVASVPNGKKEMRIREKPVASVKRVVPCLSAMPSVSRYLQEAHNGGRYQRQRLPSCRGMETAMLHGRAYTRGRQTQQPRAESRIAVQNADPPLRGHSRLCSEVSNRHRSRRRRASDRHAGRGSMTMSQGPERPHKAAVQSSTSQHHAAAIACAYLAVRGV